MVTISLNYVKVQIKKGIIRSVCIDDIADFETRQMTVVELVETLCDLGPGDVIESFQIHVIST